MHDADRWSELGPGALLVGLGGLRNSFVLFPWLVRARGDLRRAGVAAGLLYGFFLVRRAVELAASLNATLTEERRRRVPP